MALLRRRVPHPVHTTYQAYKRYLREDFAYRCVCCDIHENEFGSHRGFHVEHFRPKSIPRFRDRETDYGNLLYGCSVCNSYKGNDWPSDDPIGDGVGNGYLDPCEHDYDDHFQLDGDEVSGRTPVGAYMARRLRLNRPQLKTIRALRRRAEEQHRARLAKLEQVIDRVDRLMTAGVGSATDQEGWRRERDEAVALRDEERDQWRDRWRPPIGLDDYG